MVSRLRADRRAVEDLTTDIPAFFVVLLGVTAFLSTAINAWTMSDSAGDEREQLRHAERLLAIVVRDPAVASPGGGSGHLDPAKLDSLTIGSLRHLHLPEQVGFTFIAYRSDANGTAQESGRWSVGDVAGPRVTVSRVVAFDRDAGDARIVDLGLAVIAIG